MHNSKLIELIATFETKERNQLLKFVRFHNKNDGQSILLLEYIIKVAPAFNSARLEKQKVFKALFPKRSTYDDVAVRRSMSRLFTLCEDFIIYRHSQNDERHRQVELMKFYGDQKLDRHFGTVLKSWRKNAQKELLINDSYFLNEFQVEREIAGYSYRKQDRTVKPNLEQVAHHLNAFFLMNTLKIFCTNITYQILNNTEYDLPFMEEVLLYLKKHWENCPAIVQAYYFSLLTLVDGEEENHFRLLKKILLTAINQFHPIRQKDLISFAQNYCIKRINRGDKQYLTELLELYKMGLETEAVLEGGTLSPLDYQNIVTLGTRIKDYDWTEQFIEEYRYKLEELFRESAYHYNLARLFFSKKEFNEVVGLLHQVEHRELFVDLSVKVLLLKTYYELEEVEALVSLTESFRMFLSRKKNIGYHKNRYQSFLKFFRHLNRLQMASSEEKGEFREQVLNAKGLIEKDWFLEKIK